jgi:hypothetical protein
MAACGGLLLGQIKTSPDSCCKYRDGYAQWRVCDEVEALEWRSEGLASHIAIHKAIQPACGKDDAKKQHGAALMAAKDTWQADVVHPWKYSASEKRNHDSDRRGSGWCPHSPGATDDGRCKELLRARRPVAARQPVPMQKRNEDEKSAEQDG